MSWQSERDEYRRDVRDATSEVRWGVSHFLFKAVLPVFCLIAVIASPDLDGSYGDNGNAIFFFTATDAYVEWNGMARTCCAISSTPPELHIEVTEKP